MCGIINTNLLGVSGRDSAKRFISLWDGGSWGWVVEGGVVVIVIGEFDFGGVHREPSLVVFVSNEVRLICLFLFSINIFLFYFRRS